MAGAVVGSRERIAAVRSAQIDTGATLGPFAAFLVLRGIATLAVRVERQSQTAAALAAFLEGRDGVARRDLSGPGQPSPASRRAADPRHGRRDAVGRSGRRPRRRRAFFDALQIPERTASLGSVHTMVVHPPTSSHRSLDAASLAAAGITEGLLRVSVGLEDEADLIADFGQALEAARAASPTPVATG